MAFAFRSVTNSHPWQNLGEHGLRLEVLHDGQGDMRPVLSVDFPDPSVMQGKDGTWYAFGTEADGVSVQVARAEGSDPFGEWELLNMDAMPEDGWTSGRNTWAPDVVALPDGSYMMYFTGEVPDSHRHCIGVARSQNITGPYEPDDKPWVCPLEQGGAIDASGFLDPKTGRRFVTYKIDGESAGEFAPCGEATDDPDVRTPLMLQEVSPRDGSTKMGDAVELVDRIAAVDGPLIEAPSLAVWEDGTYLLFFSSHCYFDERYDIKYAASSSGIMGPYRRAKWGGRESMLQKPDFGLDGPGGMTAATTEEGEAFLAFHGNCEQGRCMYVARYGDSSKSKPKS